jgi:hypothetical protein
VGNPARCPGETAGERLLVLAAALTLVTAAGLVGGAVGSAGRYLAMMGALGLALLAAQVGASGGELVYRHGASAAYLDTAGGIHGAGTPARPADEDHEMED